MTNAKQITKIERQVAVKIPNERNKGIIDVLLTVDDYKVIIEDKIYSAADDSQIDKYIDALKTRGEKNIIGVFYKPVSQCYFSSKFFTFTRDILFSILIRTKILGLFQKILGTVTFPIRVAVLWEWLGIPKLRKQ